MKNLGILSLLLLASCTGTRPGFSSTSAAATRLEIKTQGPAYHLQFVKEALAFCDAQGSRKLDLGSGQVTTGDLACKKEEANTACSGLSLDVSVRSPSGEPNDIVDVDGSSYPVKGHVNDCVAEDKTIAVVTDSQVALIDTAKDAIINVDSAGGDRVALSPKWIAWTNGSTLHAVLNQSVSKGAKQP